MYQHIVQYYETDMMGITHHSNYIRFMEEARIRYLKDLGMEYSALEKRGIISPILSVEFEFKKATTFGECIFISVVPELFSGVKLVLYYEMSNEKGEQVGRGRSVNAFVDRQMKPIRLKKDYPEIYDLLARQSEAGGSKKTDTEKTGAGKTGESDAK